MKMQNKYIYMRRGLSLIRPETTEEWLEFVDENMQNRFTIPIVVSTIIMMEKLDQINEIDKLEQHKFYEKAENEVYASLYGFMLTGTIEAVSHFSKKCYDYRKYLKEKQGVSNEEKIIVDISKIKSFN